MANLATISNNILADSGIDDINVIVSTGSYANPAWITSLAWTKITGAPSNIVTGTGTTNYLSKWGSSTSLTDSIITDDGSRINILGPGTTINGGWTVNQLNTSIYPVIAFNSTATPNRFAGIGYEAASTSGLYFWVNSSTLSAIANNPALYIRNSDYSVNVLYGLNVSGAIAGSSASLSQSLTISGSTNEQLVLNFVAAAGSYTHQSFRLNGVNQYRFIGDFDGSFILRSDVASSNVLSFLSTGAATFASTLTTTDKLIVGVGGGGGGEWTWDSSNAYIIGASGKTFYINANQTLTHNGLKLSTTGAAEFSSSLYSSGNLTGTDIVTARGATPYFRWNDAAGTRLAYIQHSTNLVYNADTGIHVFNQAISGTTATFSGAVNISTTWPTTQFPLKVDDGTYGIFTAAQSTLNFNFGHNDDSEGYINWVGYNGGTTRFRNLVIADGKNATIAQFVGSTKATSLAGSLSAVFAALATASNTFLVSDGGVVKYRTAAQVLSDIGAQAALTNPVTGTGTNDYHAKWSGGGTSLTNSIITDDGQRVNILGPGTALTGGWKMTQLNTAIYPVIGFNSTATPNRFAGIGYEAASTSGLYFWVDSSTVVDTTSGTSPVMLLRNSDKSVNILNGLNITGATSGTSATFSGVVTTNERIQGNNSDRLILSSNSAAGEISFWANQGATRLMTLTGGGILNINNTSNTTYTLYVNGRVGTTGDYRSFQNASSNGYVGIASGGSAAMIPMFYGLSESESVGTYYIINRATNQAAITGYNAAAFLFTNEFDATTGNLFKVQNNYNDRFTIAYNGDTTVFGNFGVGASAINRATIRTATNNNLDIFNETNGVGIQAVNNANTAYRTLSILGSSLSFTGAATFSSSLITGDYIRTSGTATYVRTHNYTWIGGSGGDYGSVGYNIGYTSTSTTYNYVLADFASMIRFDSGGFAFLTAPAGTAGAAMTVTARMIIANSGALTVNGNTQINGGLTTNSTVTTGDILYLGASGGGGGRWTWDSTSGYIIAPSGKHLWLSSNGGLGTNGIRVNTNGTVQIGTDTAIGYKLDVKTSSATGLAVHTDGSTVGSPSIDILNSGSGVEAIISCTSSTFAIGSYSNHEIAFQQAATTKMRLLTDGQLNINQAGGNQWKLYINQQSNLGGENGIYVRSGYYPAIHMEGYAGVAGGGKWVINTFATGYGSGSLAGSMLLQSDNALQFSTGGDNVAMTIASSTRYVAIGNTSPATPFHVTGGPSGTGGWNKTATLQSTFPMLIFNSNATKWGGIGYDYSGGMAIWVNATSDDISSVSTAIYVTNNREVLINTTTDSGAYPLQVSGATYSSGGFFESSDLRLKIILNRHESQHFDAMEYKWKDGRDDKIHWGYAAQEVMQWLPDAVSGSEDKFYTLDYNQVHTYKIAMLEKRIVELEQQLKNK
jgi:hypothetical protein